MRAINVPKSSVLNDCMVIINGNICCVEGGRSPTINPKITDFSLMQKKKFEVFQFADVMSNVVPVYKVGFFLWYFFLTKTQANYFLQQIFRNIWKNLVNKSVENQQSQK